MHAPETAFPERRVGPVSVASAQTCYNASRLRNLGHSERCMLHTLVSRHKDIVPPHTRLPRVCWKWLFSSGNPMLVAVAFRPNLVSQKEM